MMAAPEPVKEEPVKETRPEVIFETMPNLPKMVIPNQPAMKLTAAQQARWEEYQVRWAS
jgi:hypothetical protein